MAMQIEKLTKSNVVATYHTITSISFNFVSKDANSFVGFIVVSSYKDAASRQLSSRPLETKSYSLTLSNALLMANNSEKPCREAAYIVLKSLDPFWEGSVLV